MITNTPTRSNANNRFASHSEPEAKFDLTTCFIQHRCHVNAASLPSSCPVPAGSEDNSPQSHAMTLLCDHLPNSKVQTHHQKPFQQWPHWPLLAAEESTPSIIQAFHFVESPTGQSSKLTRLSQKAGKAGNGGGGVSWWGMETAHENLAEAS